MKDYSGRLRRDEWEVRTVSIEVARRIVERYHYSRGASNTRTFLHGLFRRGSFFDEECQGIAWWLPPTRSCAEATYPENWRGVLSLSRLVICPGVPKNACTFLLSRSVKLIPQSSWPCLVTYADDWRGHSGGIYRACNWTYLGKTKPQSTFTLNGVLTSRKAGPKTRTLKQMISLGAVFEGNHAKHKFVLIRNRLRRHSPRVQIPPRRLTSSRQICHCLDTWDALDHPDPVTIETAPTPMESQPVSNCRTSASAPYS